ncbi:MAG TPA: hypothetical protein VKX49_15965 [Bryobacteraceae bacterium]|nr:hypothetical protein [Bryobacteraceae bacterium]
MSYSLLILLASGCVALIALWGILSAWREVGEFRRGLRSLPPDRFPSGTAFPSGRESCRLANEFLTLCAQAADRQMLGALHIDRALAPVNNYFRTRVNTPKSLAGVLVLCGLLVTLLNLQGSVGRLGASFQNLSVSQSDVQQSTAARSVNEIQTAMGEIAGRAHDAFLQSFGVILLSSMILWLALLLNNKAQGVCRDFAVWANATHVRSLVERPPVQETQVEKLSELIVKLSDVAGTFETIGPAIASVGDLGAKLDASSQLVAEAVSKLPATINESVGQLSLEVTRDISAQLNHQIEYLKKVLAIYGDQTVRVTKLQEYLDKLGESMESSMKALKGLAALPGKIDSLSEAVQSFTTASARAIAACEHLDAKVDQIPALDLGRVEGIGARVDELTDRMKSLRGEIRDFGKKIPQIVPADITAKLDSIEKAMSSLRESRAATSTAAASAGGPTIHLPDQAKDIVGQVGDRLRDRPWWKW